MLAASLTLAATAFDSEGWFAKRYRLTADAMRLRKEYQKYESCITSPSENLAIPLEAYPSGTVRSLVKAKEAQFFVDVPYIWAKDLEVMRLDDAGKEEMRLNADRCLIDRVVRSGWIEGHAKVRQGATVFEGDEIYFSASNNFVSAYSRAVVNTGGFVSDDQNVKKSRIRSRRAFFDREEGVIMFDKNVDVDYAGEYQMNADRVFAFLKNTNKLSRIVATGGVVITNGARIGSCEMAVYRDFERRIEMYAGTNSLACIAETSGRHNDVKGTKITFWMDAEQVEVISPVITLEEQDVR